MAENIAGVRVVQAFSREEENLSRFQQLHDTHNERSLAAAKVFHTYMPFVGFMSGLGTVLILGYGGTLVMRREITVGELAAGGGKPLTMGHPEFEGFHVIQEVTADGTKRDAAE
jgi:ATP-binding cassette subfamily B protein